MTRSTLRTFTASCVILAALGCGGKDRRTDDATASAAPGGSATPAAAAAGDCPETGLWQRCGVETRLERAGLVATVQEDTVRSDLFSVPGLAYALGRGELQVFLYADSAARVRDTGGLDTVRVSKPGQAPPWRGPATLMSSGNLAAVYIGANETQAERVKLALGAGLPR